MRCVHWQAPQQLQLELQPGRAGTCSIHRACAAMNTVRDRLDTARRERSSMAFHAPCAQASQPARSLDDEVGYWLGCWNRVVTAVASCFGQRLTHALARRLALRDVIDMLHQEECVCSATRRQAGARDRLAELYQSTVRAPSTGVGECDSIGRLQRELLLRARVRRRCKACDIAAAVCSARAGSDCRCQLIWSAHDAWMAHYWHYTKRQVALATCVAQLRAAAQEARQELRAAVLQHMMRRLVDQNLRAIKAQLWRPQGRLVQQRMVAAGVEAP